MRVDKENIQPERKYIGVALRLCCVMKKIILYNSLTNSRKRQHPLICCAAGCANPQTGYCESVSGSVKDYCGIFWCSSGSAEFEVGGKKLRLFSGDAVCYFARESHRIEVSSSGFVYYWAACDGVLAGEYLKALNINSGEKIHLEESLKENFDALFDTLRINTVKSCYDGAVILNRIFSTAAMAREGEILTDTGNEHTPLIRWFKDLVMSEFHNPSFNLDAISTRLGVHRSTLDRAVKKHLGMAPGEYLQDFRLKVALSKLKTSVAPVSEIGGECGFANSAYFSKVVKKRTGLTPKKFREQG